LLADLGDSKGHTTFRSELVWREFYADVLYHRPESARHNLQVKMDSVPQDTDAAAKRRFDRWASGTTGFPIVDAGMRQLLATGWMHNRVRMITASFLVKDLHLPWQWGARHFLDHLVDGDLASNNLGWQWVAGTGTDAAPYFRIFNPLAQSQRFDPDGRYIRRWLPELQGVADRNIHAPCASSNTPPLGYVAPMVDHAVEREEALRRYAMVTRPGDAARRPGTR
jgi:deoxyribodipyrimidine photo-lyase